MMSDVSSIFLDTLPSVAFCKYRELPTSPGIYFARLPNGNAAYIGSTINLQQRWTNHHMSQELEENGCVTIAYYLCKEEELNQLEHRMIQELNPSLNGPWYPRPIRLSTEGAWARIGIAVPPDLWQQFRIACLKQDISASKAITALMVEQLARWEKKLGRGKGSDFPTLPGDGLLNEIPETIATLDAYLREKERP
jgi:hypothetical protein